MPVSKFQKLETFFIGTCLEGFFWGFYSAIFSMYLQLYISEERTSDKKKNIIFYSHCALYVLSGATFAFDLAWITIQYFDLTQTETNILYYLVVVTNALYGCCNFLSQSILIYRCWIVWGRNIYVVIIPSILTLAYIPIWLTSIGSVSVSNNELVITKWDWALISTSFSMSLAVNAVVTSLILFRIVKVYWEVEPILYEQILDPATGDESKFRSIAFALIESAIALFALQVILVVCGGVATGPAGEVGNLTIGTHQMLLGIAPTIIQVRVAIGLSFHNEGTMIESSVGTASGLRFGAGDADSILEVGRIVHQESVSGGCDTIDFQGGNYIKETER